MRNPHSGNNVVITREEYRKLKMAQEQLRCLEAGGVDNWEWYGDSLRPFWKKYYPEDFDDASEE